jgi:hypothetical protein
VVGLGAKLPRPPPIRVEIFMAKQIKIENFRCFKTAEVSDCRRINVVVGENGSGKTALLESVLLTAGAGAELGLRARILRGFDQTHGQAQVRELDEGLWGDLFYDFDFDSKVSIRLSGTEEHNRSVKISFVRIGPTVVRVSKERNLATVDSSGPTGGVLFEWQGPKNIRYKSEARFEDNKLRMTGDTISPIHLAFWAANIGYSSAETASRFSALSKKNDTDEISRVFREHFPVVQDLSLEMSAGSPMVFAKISRGRRIPLNLISGGMTKLSSILFAIPSMPKGIMIIDEIENGFYYKRFPMIWSALNSLTQKYDVQVFVSTHSLECLRAAADEARKGPEDFSLIRVQREDGKFSLKQFSGEQFVGSVEADLEIR